MPSSSSSAESPLAPTLVLIPGMACDAETWAPLLPALQAHGRVEVSDAPQRGDSLPEMAAHLLATHPGPLVLAGCSMGAMIALHAWPRAGGRIRAMALLGTTARPDTDALKALRTEAIGLYAQGRMDEVLRANALFAFHPAHGQRLLPNYLAMIRRAGADGLIRQNRAVMARADLRPQLPEVTCPVLVIGGQDDQLTPPDRQREIADSVAGAALHLVPECGHMLTWEQPEAVAALLAPWWQALAGGGRG